MRPPRAATALLAFLPAQVPDDPLEQLRAAEELACQGRYADARALYERIAADHPSDDTGRIAAERTKPSAFLGSCAVITHGPASNRVDIAILGDGYTSDHQRSLAKLAEDVPPLFERVEPFREYWSYHNFVRGICVSADAGVDGFGRQYDTLLGGYTLDTDDGHVGIDHERARDVLSRIPGSDGVAIVFAKLGVAGTGGGGIAVIGGRDAKTTIHEWGHAFGGLGDEYSTYTHRRGPVSDGINVASVEDPKRVPWRHWIDARHPSVGVYEGANGQVSNAWRPTASGCIMSDGEEFCPVCREALVLRIYSLVDPIEEVSPPAPPPGIREPIVLSKEPVEIRVRTLRPATHDLEVSWWLEPASLFPPTTGVTGAESLVNLPTIDRRQRGPLPEMAGKPVKRHGAGPDGLAALRLTSKDLEPGFYRLTCRVRDKTDVRGERFPWVLRDDLGLLESERVWWLEVR